MSRRVRPVTVEVSPPDYMEIGSSQSKLHSLISRWAARRANEQSTKEEYGEQDEQEVESRASSSNSRSNSSLEYQTDVSADSHGTQGDEDEENISIVDEIMMLMEGLHV